MRMVDCDFTGNIGGQTGGLDCSGIDVDIEITDCRFRDNIGGWQGGGLQVNGPAVLNRCEFTGNQTIDDPVIDFIGGGAMYLSGAVDVVNCLVSGNRSTQSGGGIWVISGGITPVRLINTTVVNNVAAINGGGIGLWIDSLEPEAGLPIEIHNSILWSNVDQTGGTEIAQIFNNPNEITLNHSTIDGLTGALGGPGNIGFDPRFVDADGLDDMPGTEDDDLRLRPISPAINQGDNGALPVDMTADVVGLPRISDGIVDMGAYEFQGHPCPADCAPLVGDGQVNVSDLLALLGGWGVAGSECDIAPPGGDGTVNVSDLLLMLAFWGSCQ